MPITVNEGGTLYELDTVTSNEGGTLYELDTIHSNEGGVLYEIFSDDTIEVYTTGDAGLTWTYGKGTTSRTITVSGDSIKNTGSGNFTILIRPKVSGVLIGEADYYHILTESSSLISGKVKLGHHYYNTSGTLTLSTSNLSTSSTPKTGGFATSYGTTDICLIFSDYSYSFKLVFVITNLVSTDGKDLI